MAAETGERGAAPGPRARTWRPTTLRRDLRGGRDGLKVKPDASSPFPFGLKAAGHAEPGRPLPVGGAGTGDSGRGGRIRRRVDSGRASGHRGQGDPGDPARGRRGRRSPVERRGQPGAAERDRAAGVRAGGRLARGVGPGRKARAPGRQEGGPERGDAAGGAQTRREPGRGMGTGLIQEESQN